MTSQPGRQGRPWRTAAAAVRARAARGEPCWLCGRPIDLTLPARTPWSFSAHHVVQLAHGGAPTDPGNLAPAHLHCNVRDSNRHRTPRYRPPLPQW